MSATLNPNQQSAIPRIDTEEALKVFGGRVRQARHARGLTQDALASVAGVDRKTISRIENSRFSPSLINVYAIAHALEVDAKDLI